MAAGTICNAKRRNVSPVSSTLNIATRDIDCSGMTKSPEDGEFVPQDGLPSHTQGDDSATAWHGANANAVTAEPQQATSLAMVWGSARRGDRQALGDQTVPVLMHGGAEVECQLFNILDDTKALDATENKYSVGTLLSVAVQAGALSAVAGDALANRRLVLDHMDADEVGWCVGYVTKVNAKSAKASNGDSLTVYLYDKPRFMGAALS
jgi:hypothetical protein